MSKKRCLLFRYCLRTKKHSGLLHRKENNYSKIKKEKQCFLFFSTMQFLPRYNWASVQISAATLTFQQDHARKKENFFVENTNSFRPGGFPLPNFYFFITSMQAPYALFPASICNLTQHVRNFFSYILRFPRTRWLADFPWKRSCLKIPPKINKWLYICTYTQVQWQACTDGWLRVLS